MLGYTLSVALILVQCVIGQEMISFYQSDLRGRDIEWDRPEDLKHELDSNDDDQITERSLYSYICHFKNDYGSGQCMSLPPSQTSWQSTSNSEMFAEPTVVHPINQFPPSSMPVQMPTMTPNWYPYPMNPYRFTYVPNANVMPYPNTMYTLPMSQDNQLAPRFLIDDLFDNTGPFSSLLTSVSPFVDALTGRSLNTYKKNPIYYN